MGGALLTGVAELLGRMDVLAGRGLVYIEDVRRLASGRWLIERFALIGEVARRIESLEQPESDTPRLPRPERIYFDVPGPQVIAQKGQVASRLRPRVSTCHGRRCTRW